MLFMFSISGKQEATAYLDSRNFTEPLFVFAIMVIAVLLAVAIMIFAAGTVRRFVDRHPTIKMLALSFLVLVGVTLIAEGWGFHIPKGYIYFSMAFAVGVEMLNLRARRRRQEPLPNGRHVE